MSDWNDLPEGFLGLGRNRWLRLDADLRALIVNLAQTPRRAGHGR